MLLPTDDDECKNGLHNCDLNANCINTHGSFECICNDGFFGDGKLCISKLIIMVNIITLSRQVLLVIMEHSCSYDTGCFV